MIHKYITSWVWGKYFISTLPNRKNKKLGLNFFLISRQQSDLKYYFENYFCWCLSSVLQDGGLTHVVLLTSMECIIHYDRTTTNLMGSSGTTGRARDTLSKLQLWWFDQQISKYFVIMWIIYCIVFKDLFYQATCLIFSSPETCTSVLKGSIQYNSWTAIALIS